MKIYNASIRRPIFYDTFDHVVNYFGILITVFLLSFLVSLTIEAPFLNLEKLLFNLLPRNSSTVFVYVVAGNDVKRVVSVAGKPTMQQGDDCRPNAGVNVDHPANEIVETQRKIQLEKQI